MRNQGQDGPEVRESGGTGCNPTLSSWGGRSSLSLSGNQGLGLRSVYLRESLQTSGRALVRVLGWQPGTSPARAEHRVSVEHVAEPINKGGGWRARAGGALRATGWRLPCSAASVWAGPQALNPSSGLAFWMAANY